jgi:hypothetical protein
MRSTVAVLTLLLGACNWEGDCISIGRPSHRITIRDSRTGALVAAGAVVIVTGQAFRDSVRINENVANATVAFERDDPLTLEVRQVGYQVWTRSGLQAVRHGSCNYIRAVDVTALLVAGSP